MLLSGGTKGKRYSLPNSTIHMHQPLGGAQGQASDIEIAAREIIRLQDKLRTMLAENTGQPYDKSGRRHRPGLLPDSREQADRVRL